MDEVYVYCSKDEIKSFVLDGVHYLKRDGRFDSSTVNVNEMFYAFANDVEADIYVLAHATAPFQRNESIDCGINAVKSGKYDSAIAVKSCLYICRGDSLQLYISKQA